MGDFHPVVTDKTLAASLREIIDDLLCEASSLILIRIAQNHKSFHNDTIVFLSQVSLSLHFQSPTVCAVPCRAGHTGLVIKNASIGFIFR